jgi:hypothetical protein
MEGSLLPIQRYYPDEYRKDFLASTGWRQSHRKKLKFIPQKMATAMRAPEEVRGPPGAMAAKGAKPRAAMAPGTPSQLNLVLLSCFVVPCSV